MAGGQSLFSHADPENDGKNRAEEEGMSKSIHPQTAEGPRSNFLMTKE
jgi:hypothetical protein